MQTRFVIAPAPALMICLAGCATSPPTTAADSPATLDDAGTTEVAEQARRDVEQLRRLQQQTGAAAGHDRMADASTDAAPGPPRIDWILPTPPGRVKTPGQAGTGGSQGPLAGDPPRTGDGALPLPMPGELPGASVATEEPPEVAEPDVMRQLVVDLSAELYRRGAYSDMPLRELLVIAATTMVTPDRALVPEALPGLTPREREIVGLMQDFFRRLGQELEDKGDPEVLVAAIDELSQLLQKKPGLVLPQTALCSRVGGFGDYDEFPRVDHGRYRFLAHNGQQAVVYVEVDMSKLGWSDERIWTCRRAGPRIYLAGAGGF